MDRIGLVCLIALTCGAVPSVGADLNLDSQVPPPDLDVERLHPLDGLPPFYVLVENLSEELEKAGPGRDQIQADVELRLRTSGLAVIAQSTGEPYLYVNILDLPFPVGWSYYTTVELNDKVVPNRFLQRCFNAGVKVATGDRALAAEFSNGCLRLLATTGSNYAPIWQRSVGGVIGLGVAGGIREAVRQSVNDLVDRFLNDYLSTNPKKGG